MKALKNTLIFFISLLSLKLTSAHEAYVLNQTDFWNVVKHDPTEVNIFSALSHPGAIKLAIIITLVVMFIFLANFIFRRTKFGQKVNGGFEKLSFLGPTFVRLAVAITLFFSALSMSFLGPEIKLTSMIVPQILQIALFMASGMILLGLFTEIAAGISLAVFTIGIAFYGIYMITYLNYLGEFAVLMLFGLRKWSVDRFIFGKLKRFEFFKKYETSIIRVCYGIALIFAAVTIKLIHPSLTLDVINEWNLLQFHWLFPNDALLVVMGAFLAEAAIGLFIILGFEMRLTIIVELFYLTLSLIYFRELVWPHLILYGISLNLLVQPEVFTLDHLFFKKHREKKKWWLRPFSPHLNEKETKKWEKGKYKKKKENLHEEIKETNKKIKKLEKPKRPAKRK